MRFLPLAAFAIAPGAFAQGFAPLQNMPWGFEYLEYTNWVTTADLDGDGDLDVLAADGATDEIAWWRNLGGGSFSTTKILTSLTDGAFSVEAADLDGDGDMDVVSASIQDGKVAWYENIDGLGSFGPQQLLAGPTTGAWSVRAADLDGDGDPDVVAALDGEDEVAWWENTDGQAAFGPKQVVASGVNEADTVDVADLDGDGDLDVLSGSWADDLVYWSENLDGLGSLWERHTLAPCFGVERVVAADVNGDGFVDVLTAGIDDGIAWYENTDGLGTFGPKQLLASSADVDWRSVFAADLDRDGDRDVLACGSDSLGQPQIEWYENTDGTGGSWSAQTLFGPALFPRAVHAADLDGDLFPEILVSTAGNPPNQDGVSWAENLFEPLLADVQAVSLAAGGAQTLELTGGPENGLQLYFVLGTSSGTSPGTPFGGLTWPLVLDAYSVFTLANANGAVLVNTLGTLDAKGSASAAVQVPVASNPALAGTTLHHAFGAFDLTAPAGPELTSVSNAVALTLEP